MENTVSPRREPRLRVAFVHPDLGIGGSERFVLDAARSLARCGHAVTIHTSAHDRRHRFEATDEPRVGVRVRGGWIPRQLAHRLRAPLAILRVAWLARRLATDLEKPDVVVCDLVSHGVPLLRRWTRARVVFYCHYPDRLLIPSRGGAYRLYRRPIDRLEERGLALADAVAVNSRFTLEALRTTFPTLTGPVEVVYPGVDVAAYAGMAGPAPGPPRFLVLTRFDPRKHQALALEAFAALRGRVGEQAFAGLQLVLAGGYDSRLREARRIREGLARRVGELGLAGQVQFRLSPSEAERLRLLRECSCVIHPVDGEHFGYVPVEAMAAGRPVIAVDRGGPVETIVDGRTGWLCRPTADAFADAMARVAAGAGPELGRQARDHVRDRFSLARFAPQFERLVRGGD